MGEVLREHTCEPFAKGYYFSLTSLLNLNVVSFFSFEINLNNQLFFILSLLHNNTFGRLYIAGLCKFKKEGNLSHQHKGKLQCPCILFIFFQFFFFQNAEIFNFVSEKRLKLPVKKKKRHCYFPLCWHKLKIT